MALSRYQEPMANGENHPLKHVPQQVLDAAADALYEMTILDSGGDGRRWLDGDVTPIADAIVMAVVRVQEADQ